MYISAILLLQHGNSLAGDKSGQIWPSFLLIILSYWKGVVASWFVRSPSDYAVWVRALTRDIVLCSLADTLLSQCLSPTRCINGYQRI